MPLILNGTTGVSGIDGSAGTPSYVGGDSDTGLWYPAANTLALSTSGSERLRIDSSGNVGIGTSSPASILDVAGSASGAYIAQILRNTNSGGYAQQIFQIGSANGTANVAYAPGIFFALGPSANDTTTPIVFQNNNATERMRITSSGDVGIGTTSPKSVGNYRFVTTNATTGSGYSVQVNGTEASNFYANTGATVVQEVRALPLVFETNATERMRIDSSGRTMINTTTQSARFTVAANSGDQQAAAFFSANSTLFNIALACGQGNVQMYLASVSTTDESVRWINSGGGEVARIINNGNFTIQGATATKASGTTWANPSDVRLKENITDFTKGLAELKQVNVKTWEYNGKGGTTAGTKGLGVIADEIMQVLPETVDTYKAKLNKDDAEESDIKRFDATEITWLLVNAIKEQQAMIEELKAKVAALEK